MVHRVRAVVALAGVAFVALASSAEAALTQVPVKATALAEQGPGTGAGTFAWSQNRTGHRGVVNLFVEAGSGPAVRVNPPHTRAWAGSIDGTTLVYQQVSRRSNQSDLHLWDLTTHTRSTPAGVNTPGWEFRATMSGPWILFGREALHSSRWRVILHNTATAQTITLADVSGRGVSAHPGQVNGTWAVWDVCRRVCNVFRYDITAATTTKIPNTLRGKFQYFPSVSADGTAYFAHSGRACGANTRLVKQPTNGPAEVLVALRSGVELWSRTQAVADPTSGTDLYYDKFRCGKPNIDIYKVVIP